jgi:hypothetical protein
VVILVCHGGWSSFHFARISRNWRSIVRSATGTVAQLGPRHTYQVSIEVLPESIDGGGTAPPSIVKPIGYLSAGRHDLPLSTRMKRLPIARLSTFFFQPTKRPAAVK